MKKVFIFALVAGAFAMTSCKKNWTCECTADDGQGNVATSQTTYEDMTKKDAEAGCNYTISSGGASTTCEIID